jgi:predicted DNA binding CopG/RHH family protein
MILTSSPAVGPAPFPRAGPRIDADEKELLESVERGEWKSADRGNRERTRYSRYAKGTFRKDRRQNIRLSSNDLEAIQKRALAEGLPYQTLITSLLHKCATGAPQRDLNRRHRHSLSQIRLSIVFDRRLLFSSHYDSSNRG